MGTIRALLAIMVVIGHLDFPFPIFDSRFAVQMFFLISGFYMSMVWSNRYQYHIQPVRTFYICRALRIYPVYLLVLVASILLAWCAMLKGVGLPFMAHRESPLSASGSVYTYLSQLTILGIAPRWFLARSSDGALSWAAGFNMNADPDILSYEFVPQAWTLDLELMFYLLAPFVLSRWRVMLVLLFAALASRAYYWNEGFNMDPWTYRFFPWELALFLAGGLSQQVWVSKRQRIRNAVTTRWVWILIGISPILMAIEFNVFHRVLGEAAYWICYAYVCLSMPFLFDISRMSAIDRWIGELSFPIYISHMFVVFSFLVLGTPLDVFLALICTLLLSMFLVRFQRSIDSYRHGITSKPCDITRLEAQLF